MSIEDYTFSGTMKATGASDLYVTLDEKGHQVVICKHDVIALAKHFKLTANDLNTD